MLSSSVPALQLHGRNTYRLWLFVCICVSLCCSMFIEDLPQDGSPSAVSYLVATNKIRKAKNDWTWAAVTRKATETEVLMVHI
jgi:hypothetical protein